MAKPNRVCSMYKYPIFQSEEGLLLAKLAGQQTKLPNDDPGCFIGIEVEVENTQALDGLQMWTVTKDNSLRNNGYEFVSKPIRGRLVELALVELEAHLKKRTPKHTFSDRTSVHIHVNVRHLEMEQLASLILLYTALEPLFFKYTEKIPNANRRENNYCVPIEDSKSFIRYMAGVGNYYKHKNPEYLKNSIEGWKKYTALNLLPIINQGTIEFRHMGGNIDVPYIMTWINMILSLRKYCRETSTDVIKSELFSLNTNSQYSYFINKVLGTDPGIPFDELMNLLEDSVASTKDIFVTIDVLGKEEISVRDFLKTPLAVSFNSLYAGLQFNQPNQNNKELSLINRAISSLEGYIKEIKEGWDDEDDMSDDAKNAIEEYEEQIHTHTKRKKEILETMNVDINTLPEYTTPRFRHDLFPI